MADFFPTRGRLWVLLFFLLMGVGRAEAEGRPNILLILMDDLGWSDLACQGNPLVETPRIDHLAEQGMRFTDAYSAAPVCSPTRAAFMTGLSPARLHITNHIPDEGRFVPDDAKLRPAKMLDHLPLEHVTIAERLRDAGYATAFLGKWHLCGDWTPRDGGRGKEKFHPEHQGFEVNLGGCARGGPSTFFDPYNIDKLPDRKAGEYLPDRLADEAIGLIERRGGRPFFLALWHYTVHWPMEAPGALLKKYESRTGPGLNDTRYGAMIEAMDSAVGRVLKALDEEGIAEETLVVFTSDNGGFSGVADNRPLRAGKGYLYEGGIRVPLIVRWPGRVPAGAVCATPVVSMDFYPTFLEAAGLPAVSGRELDGESLVPLLEQRGGLRRKAIYFHAPNYAFHRGNRLGGAMRDGDYKLIENFDDGSLELYNLAADLGERKNLASRMEDKAREMQRRLRLWRERSGAWMPTLVRGE